ncbi:putative l-isoaspartyl protein carboxyl methyltransferase [Meredithblackwellia eburnea MCA 4105]
MAWTCTSTSNSGLINNLVQASLLTSQRAIQAFKQVDRAHFVTRSGEAYLDSPSYIGYGATISAPHMHCHAVEDLLPFLTPGSSVLDVGSGSGYLLPVFHHLVSPTDSGKKGRVLGIDHLTQLVDLATTNLSKNPLFVTPPASILQSSTPSVPVQEGHIKVILADGRKGAPTAEVPEGFAGWDAIHVGAASREMPEALVEQLAKPGRMFVPVGGEQGQSTQVDKDQHGQVTKTKLFGVNYIP